jgi:hypothetical protein
LLVVTLGSARVVAEPLGEQFGDCRDSRLYALVIGGNEIGGLDDDLGVVGVCVA